MDTNSIEYKGIYVGFENYKAKFVDTEEHLANANNR